MNLIQFKQKLDESIGYKFISSMKTSDLVTRIDYGTDILNVVKQFRSLRKNIYLQGGIDENDSFTKEFFRMAEALRYKLKLPRITIINSGNIFGFSMDYLKHLLIDDYLEKRIITERCILGDRLKRNELDEIKLQFKSSLIQAIEYLNNAIKSDLAISPVLLYYSLVNFLYCYSLLKYKDAIPDNTYKKHGIIVSHISKDNLLSTEVKISDSSNIKPYMVSNQLRLKDNTYSILDAIKSLNYMTTTLTRFGIDTNILTIYDQSNDTIDYPHPTGSFPARITFQVKHFFELTGHHNISTSDEVPVIIKYLMPEFTEFFKTGTVKVSETHLVPSSFGSLCVVDFCPQATHQRDIIEFLTSHRDQNANRFIIIEKKTDINDQVFHIYTSSFFFGHISRYQPQIWYKFIGDEANKVLIERYINSTAIYILYKFLTLFSGEYLVFK